ncbi:hypothetical protein CERZMDRAFT_114780 [Cercospora zeae-maydis SCOH1-5]|uniref:Glucose-methanol-choline oxidoreductase N-terminal domain-containing protein n=1 Tax=Cercospora zeae-maydis SCOH1-5 TaxID=717836 RepID=A0A6A6F3J4_9PEZI|nr:hypothetical protein CERZMDRAFT_114780 [Cercospora zeae-maydis SCOH1-5]
MHCPGHRKLLPLATRSRAQVAIAICMHLNSVNAEYDYVIVGGGSAGLVVANRLSSHAERTVLVVEYGYLDNNASTLIPYNVNEQSHADLTNLTSAPLQQLGNITYPVSVGATVGGGSVVNGLYFNRGSKADYDAWKALGNNGWGWDDLLPYFRKHTNFTAPTITEDFHPTWNETFWGNDGPVHASIPSFQWRQQEIFREALGGFPTIQHPQEANDGSAVGLAWVPSSQDPDMQTRSSARTAYYDPICERTNLHLLTGTKVEKVLFRNKTATGVEVISRRHSGLRSIRAKEEVIIAAGPIYSPNLLHHSGIGPHQLLQSANIPVVQDLPGVGLNFQDTPTIVAEFNFNHPVHPNPLDLKNPTYKAAALAQYYTNRTGPLTQAHGNSAAFLTLNQVAPNDAAELLQNLNVQDPAKYLPSIYDDTTRAGYKAQFRLLRDQLASHSDAAFELPLHGDGQRYIMLLQKPLSRGTVTMNLSDPDLGPLVDWNTLAHPIDAEMSIAMMRFLREFFSLPAMQVLGPHEVSPGANVTKTEDLMRAFIEDRVLYPHCSHQAGTCSMLPLELGGVVSDQLLVHGVERLSVVDSSVIPLLPGARLVSTVYAIAEKAADLIQARRG